MTTVRGMFRTGANQIQTIEWELLDNPAAREWKALTDIAGSLDRPGFSEVQATFCSSDAQANEYWDEVCFLISDITDLASISFDQLTEHDCLAIYNQIFKAQTNNQLTLDHAHRYNSVSKKLKAILFWKQNTSRPNAKSTTFGNIYVEPLPFLSSAFNPQHYEFLSNNISYGDLYAILQYSDLPWHAVRTYKSDNIMAPLCEGRFGPPTRLTNGFYVPFYRDIMGAEQQLMSFFYRHRLEILEHDRSFDFSKAVQLAGALPIARLKTPIGKIGYPSFDQLSKIDTLFKIEVDQE